MCRAIWLNCRRVVSAFRIEDEFFNSVAYADDINSVCLKTDDLQILINLCYQYSRKWRFSFGINKTHCMISILTAWRRAVWWDRFGIPSIRFIVEDWTLSMNFSCPGLSLNISRLYKRDGNPMVFHKCTLTSVAHPGYGQPTEAKAYMARRDAFTRLSIWASLDMLDVNIVSGISKVSVFFILCPPRFQDGYLINEFVQNGH